MPQKLAYFADILKVNSRFLNLLLIGEAVSHHSIRDVIIEKRRIEKSVYTVGSVNHQ